MRQRLARHIGGALSGPLGRRLVIATPYLWMTLFFLLPLVIVLKISLAESVLGRPPYTPLWEYMADGYVQLKVHLSNYTFLWEDPLYPQRLPRVGEDRRRLHPAVPAHRLPDGLRHRPQR